MTLPGRLRAAAPWVVVLTDTPRTLVYRKSGPLTAGFVEILAPWLSRRLPARLP